MRLKKILLGSAAVMMGAGVASVPAKAADMNGLVTTMANYLESCQNGNGIQFAVTCMWITGEVEFSIEHGQEITYDPANPANNTNGQVADNGELMVDFDPELNFAWSVPGYDVEIAFPITDPEDVEVDISKPGGWSLHLERPGLFGNSVIFRMPFNAFTVTLGADFDGGDPDLDLDVDAEFGNVEIGFGVHSDDWNPPTFDADVGFDIGGWGLTVYGATTGFGAGFWEPNIDVVLGGDLGPASLDLFFGYEDRATDNWAVAGEVGVGFGNTTVTVGALRSVGTSTDWDYFTDDYGTFPYTLTAGQVMFAVWGGIEQAWNAQHTSELTAFFSRSPAITDSENLRIEFTHNWTPVDGNVEVEGTVWYENDFGGGADPVWGMGLTTTIPLFPG